MRIDVKPLSVNEAWQGKRFKTKAYKDYEKKMFLLLPSLTISKTAKLKINFVFGFSNIQADLDNPVKLLLDIMQKKYSFNDSRLMLMNVEKRKVEKGKEFIEFEIKEMN